MMPSSSNRGAERLLALAPLGFFFALILSHNGHLSKTPLLIGGVGGMIGLIVKLAHRRTKEEAL